MEPLSADDPTMVGEFRLHSRLGAGGMGQVYLGFSPAGRPVAIKLVHSQLARDPEFLQRFSREVAAARSVGGMYTAPVVASGLNDHPPWLATAYVPGPPLASVISRNGPLPEPAVWRLAAGLAEALHTVHAAGLVHRDLKPANVLLANDGPHVIDFGISRAFQGTALTSGLTSVGTVIGTPGYMSPEQAQSDRIGPPSDVFSLGCVIAYAAAGKAPFEGENSAAVLFRVVTAEPDLSLVPPALRQVIQACLRKDPAQRPGLSQLVSMIAATGPSTEASLGSFWPEAVARVIAAEQAAQTPDGLTPPPAAPGPGGAGYGETAAMPGRGAERTPTALATPPPGVGPTGHAPMLSDGYMAAASGSHSAYSGPSYSGPGSYPGAPSYPGQGAYPGQAAYPGAPSYPGPPFYPGQQAPGTGTAQYGVNPGDPLAQYSPGRRKPGTSEVPGAVHTAMRLMYAGFAATGAALILSLVVLGRYSRAANAAKAAGFLRVEHTQSQMAGALLIAVIADVIGLACWAWLKMAARRGQGWTRIGATVLLAGYTIVMLLVVLGTHDPGARFSTLLVWALGLAAVIPLWTQPARQFFEAWRKR